MSFCAGRVFPYGTFSPLLLYLFHTLYVTHLIDLVRDTILCWDYPVFLIFTLYYYFVYTKHYGFITSNSLSRACCSHVATMLFGRLSKTVSMRFSLLRLNCIRTGSKENSPSPVYQTRSNLFETQVLQERTTQETIYHYGTKPCFSKVCWHCCLFPSSGTLKSFDHPELQT